MLKLILRAQVNWASGFGRYLDLFVSCMMAVIAFHTQNMWWTAFAALAFLSFIFDFNGKIQRWTLNASMAKARKR